MEGREGEWEKKRKRSLTREWVSGAKQKEGERVRVNMDKERFYLLLITSSVFTRSLSFFLVFFDKLEPKDGDDPEEEEEAMANECL